MTYDIVIARNAERDIRQAFLWWSQNRNQAEALRWYNGIVAEIQTLKHHPERCPVTPETDMFPAGIRQLHFGIGRKATHRIVFTISEDVVSVLRVRHLAQNDLNVEDLSSTQQ